jgi:hypothetical protein
MRCILYIGRARKGVLMQASKEYHRKYKEEHREEIRKYFKAYNLTYVRPEQSEQRRREKARLYEKNNHAKRLAQQAVKRALKKGVLVKPDCCEQCGGSGMLHAHHNDYEKQLDVVWLCVPCHGLLRFIV